METIEVGAVLLAGSGGPVAGEFGAFVRPLVQPRLGDLCRRLTSIWQENVDRADTFPTVLLRLET